MGRYVRELLCEEGGHVKYEVWLRLDGSLVLIEWNACGCHPFHALVHWGTKYGQCGTYAVSRKAELTHLLQRRLWERIDKF